MSRKIVLVGASGQLGQLILAELVKQGATVFCLVRRASDEVAKLGGTVVVVDFSNRQQLTDAMTGAESVVCSLQGLRDVVVDLQKSLLDAAIAAKVPRFVPSDFSIDFRSIPASANRNFALRKEFHEYADTKLNAIHVTTVFNGAFMELLSGQAPIIQPAKKSITCFGSPNVKWEFTTMQDTARFTAAVALDANPPRYVFIAGSQVTPNELAQIMSDVKGEKYTVNAGSLAMFGGIIGLVRNVRSIFLGVAAVSALTAYQFSNDLHTPATIGVAAALGSAAVAPFVLPQRFVPSILTTESQLMPMWQGMQYLHNMCAGKYSMSKLDNNRYDSSWKWTTARDYLANQYSPKKTK